MVRSEQWLQIVFVPYLFSAHKVFDEMAARNILLNFGEIFLQWVEVDLDDHGVALVDAGEVVWVKFNFG